MRLSIGRRARYRVIMLCALVCAGAAAPIPANAQAGQTYYVATYGKDTNQGTSLLAPFRHIQRCADVMVAGDSCLVRGGTYHETVTPAHAGSQGAPIVFHSYNREPVTVDGADPVSGWSRYAGHIYQAHVSVNPLLWQSGPTPWWTQLFVNGVMMSDPRWPTTSLDPMQPAEAEAEAGTTATTICDGHLAAFPAGFWAHAVLAVRSGLDWFSNTSRVITSGVSSASGPCAPGAGFITFQHLPDSGLYYDPIKGNAYHLVGGLNALRSAGEYYYDPAGQTVYLWTPRGDSPQHDRVEMKQRLFAFDLSNRSWITVKGINLFGATITTTPKTSNDDVIDGIQAAYSSHFVDFGTVDGNLVHPDTGIMLFGDHDALLNSVIDVSAGCGVSLEGSGDVVDNNLIENAMYSGASNGGICGGSALNADHALISHNTIKNVGTIGVYITGLANTVVYNNIHDHGLLNQDTNGGIHSDSDFTGAPNGGTSLIAYNWVHDNHDTYTQTLDYCPIPPYTCASPGGGIYFDLSADPFLVHHNVVWNEPYDLLVNGNGTDIHGHRVGIRNDHFYNNTLATAAPGPGSLSVSANFYDDVFINTAFQNNIFSSPISITMGSKPPLVSNNLPSMVDAQFVDAANHNYTLLPTSPAIDAGIVITGVTYGDGDAPDEGAYAYGTPRWVPGCSFAGCI